MFARYRQAGLSLVELMVSILIGLIILSGVLQVVLTSKQSFVSQDEMAYIQENARYAMDVLARDIQSAGHFGCAGVNSRLVLSIRQGSGTQLGELVGRDPLRGFGALENIAALDLDDQPEARGRRPREAGKPETRSDVLVVRRAGGAGVPVRSHLGTQITTVLPAAPVLDGVASGNEGARSAPLAVVAEDCQRVGVFRAGVGGEAGLVLEASGFACDGPLKPTTTSEFICNATCESCQNVGSISASQLYSPGAMVHAYHNYAYYIGRRGDAEPALMRAVLRGDGTLDYQEIALGVDDLQVWYGVDVNLDNQLSYLDAADVTALAVPEPWSRVRAVRISLDFRSPAPTGPGSENNEKYNDRYVRQTVESTVRLRNRT